MTIDIILMVLGGILILIGIIGCILPVLPGAPISYIGVLLLHFTTQVEFSSQFLWVWALVIILVQILDYYIPIWGTKKLGGGSKGAWGSALGVIAGMFFFPPWGLLLFPFIGAVIGELIDGKDLGLAVKAGFGAFLGFLTGTLIKLVVAFTLAFYFFREIFKIIFS